MIIGIPKEIKNNENRVGLVPSGVRQFIHDATKSMLKHLQVLELAFLTKNTSKQGQPFYLALKRFLPRQK